MFPPIEVLASYIGGDILYEDDHNGYEYRGRIRNILHHSTQDGIVVVTLDFQGMRMQGGEQWTTCTSMPYHIDPRNYQQPDDDPRGTNVPIHLIGTFGERRLTLTRPDDSSNLREDDLQSSG